MVVHSWSSGSPIGSRCGGFGGTLVWEGNKNKHKKERVGWEPPTQRQRSNQETHSTPLKPVHTHRVSKGNGGKGAVTNKMCVRRRNVERLVDSVRLRGHIHFMIGGYHQTIGMINGGWWMGLGCSCVDENAMGEGGDQIDCMMVDSDVRIGRRGVR